MREFLLEALRGLDGPLDGMLVGAALGAYACGSYYAARRFWRFLCRPGRRK